MAAAEHLKAAGVKILAQNFRNARGEIDIIGKDGEYLVFFEVKWRSGAASGYACEAVDRRKQKQICSVADHYLYISRAGAEQPVRFDVIALDGEGIEWIRDAFPYCGRNF